MSWRIILEAAVLVLQLRLGLRRPALLPAADSRPSSSPVRP